MTMTKCIRFSSETNPETGEPVRNIKCSSNIFSQMAVLV